MGDSLDARWSGVAVETGGRWRIWSLSPSEGDLQKGTKRPTSVPPDLAPQPPISGSSAGSEHFCTVILREGGERPWERILFNFLFSSGLSSSFKGDFLSHFCDVLFCFPGGRGGGLGAESWGL